MTHTTRSDRRRFLKLAAGCAGGAAVSALPASIRQALATPPATVTGTIQDVQHIVILMQENRSFDHYFGTLSGVRGFGDPRAVSLPSGQPVWSQPDGNGSSVLPFHPDARNLGLQFIEDLDHSWNGTHSAWNQGRYDNWIPAKSPTTMAYLTRDDIPFHYQLADAFTICDAYHCSMMGPTDPNRYYMWTGWSGNDGSGNGPDLSNGERGYGWTTYPELLEQAGVSWKIYQDIGTGLDHAGTWGWTDARFPVGSFKSGAYIGNYGDNSLLYFNAYRNAQPGNPLYDKARTGTNILNGGTLFDVLKEDVTNGTLPQVSWIAAPEAYTEHPNWPANYGAWYVDQILTVLTSNPDVWSKTVLLLTYDENDGFFDHMVPPVPSTSKQDGTVATTNEFFAGGLDSAGKSCDAGPFGLGPRVPMLVISPWSKGGWVCSEVFDHTSIIRFIHQRFAAQYNIGQANISPWRLAVCGDLTSALNFSQSNTTVPTRPSTTAYAPPDSRTHVDYVPVPPAIQTVPLQERGQRPARALPYELFAQSRVDIGSASFTLDCSSTGTAGAVFHVRSTIDTSGPWSLTVGAGTTLSRTWPRNSKSPTAMYDYSVYGPNGFFRGYAGAFTPSDDGHLEVAACYDVANGNVQITLKNNGTAPCSVIVRDAYGSPTRSYSVTPGNQAVDTWILAASDGWYDLSVALTTDPHFLRHLAGHVETGRSSMTDPAIKSV
ncbi:phosphocholine-specific phospholipase C [Burkholderia territorii]|uniref:phosphocholine-specific phospholipase C n=1 Tax=Burkholderia territorii TaxID=1503055 RepID=UPI0009BCCA08|nr:phospholipase C, phosphocholine-specific [Burkholderia territorii]